MCLLVIIYNKKGNVFISEVSGYLKGGALRLVVLEHRHLSLATSAAMESTAAALDPLQQLFHDAQVLQAKKLADKDAEWAAKFSGWRKLCETKTRS